VALDAAGPAFEHWSARPVAERANVLRKVADLYEDNIAELTAITTREAGKTLPDGISEVREAVDFLRYYANEAERLEDEQPGQPRGIFVCISPWNFPLAIFTGQIAAALAAGNAVLAKPAEQTPATIMMWAEMIAGILPDGVLNIVNGFGLEAGKPLASSSRIAKVAFTGETTTGRVPAGSVVVAGSLPAADGSHSLNAAIIVKQVDEKTRSRTSVNELLRAAE
jgi:RHH-type proline utilization regulon transcriptional repressor/proline dehydrogenase/delta 1-pyrroline-5-carboxylate dehydrogenase